MEELLDIVDENNNPTGKSAPRSKIHSEGIWHRTVHIYLFRKNNNEIEFLVHLRSPFKDSSPNKWDTRFGGHIKAGTTIVESVKVELEEEIGLNVPANKLIEGAWASWDGGANREYTKVYYLEYNDDLSNLKFNDGEVQEIKWMSIADIKNSITDNPEKWSPELTGITMISDYLMEKVLQK
jgi:isopentenyldiphosphate isomerase